MGNVVKQLDNNQRPLEGLYVAGQSPLVLPQAGSVQSDPNNSGQQYGPQLFQIGDRTTPTQMASVDTAGNLSVKLGTESSPPIVQKTNAVSTGSVASLAKAFTSNNTAGNSIVVVCGCGNGTAMTVADSAGNTYFQAVTQANSTTFESAIFFATNIVAGANTVTVTNAGSAASMALEIYEVSGLIAQANNILDQTASNTGTGTAASTIAIAALSPNELAFAGVAVGTANQAVTATAGTFWNVDASLNTGGTQAGLFSFGVLSLPVGGTSSFTPQATIASSEPWAMAVATFRPVLLGVAGPVSVVSSETGGALAFHLVSAGSTNATVVKAAPGTVYQVTVNCNTSAAARYVKFYDSATAPTAGAGTIYYVVQSPLLAASTGSTTVVNFPTGLKFKNGIAFVTVTTLPDAGSTGVSASDLSIDIAYI